MRLSAGTRLGPYEIVSAIGAGGMGEVYKARDTRLDRFVAIKVAQERFSERFEREARAVAALNHPHVCALYDVGPNYLVMEYVEGRPLSGPLPVDQSLRYAAQICDALDAAHRKGIVHRDLKPGNILVTKSGVKLLDFGLARIESGQSGPEDATLNPTLTRTGAVMGTPAYMAPEQWEGKPGDSRSDIYAFGCVLYEMLTGKRAADGRTAVQPVTVEAVIRACMERDPEDRWQSARDMRRALQAPVEPSPRQGPWRERVAWVGALVLAVAATLVVGTNLPRTPQTEQVFRYNIYAPPQTVFAGATFTTLSVPAFAVSPDGRNIVFAAGPQSNRPTLWVKGMDELSARPLDGTEGAENPFWAPDSRSIAFFSQGKLRTVAAIGGLVRNIADAPDPRGGSWSPNGVILFGTGTGPVFRVPESGGAKPVEVTSLNSSRREGSHRWPVFLPDGLHFLLNVRSGLAEDRGVFAGTLDGAAPIPLVRTDSAALHANGYLLFLTENTLQAQRFDLKSLELSGPAYVVAEGVGRSSTTSIAASVSNNGVLAYSGVLPSPPGRLTWVDRTGAIGNSVGPESVYADFRLSHDEKRLLASQVSVKTGVIDIHMTDLTQNRTQPFASGPFISASPLWSPDDNRVVFRTTRNGGLIDFYQKSSAGGGKYELLLAGDAATSAGTTSRNLLPLDWSTDHLLFSVNSSVGSQLWLLPTREKGKPVLYLESPSQVMHANLSPDGSLLAYTSNESGRFEVWVETVPRSDRKEQVSAAGGYEPQWNADGSELYYLSLDRKLMAVRVGANASFSDLRVLFQTGVPENIHAYHMHYLPSRDGRFLMNLQVAAPPPTPITIVHNWVQGLKE